MPPYSQTDFMKFDMQKRVTKSLIELAKYFELFVCVYLCLDFKYAGAIFIEVNTDSRKFR